MKKTEMPQEFQEFWYSKKTLPKRSQTDSSTHSEQGAEWKKFLKAISTSIDRNFLITKKQK